MREPARRPPSKSEPDGRSSLGAETRLVTIAADQILKHHGLQGLPLSGLIASVARDEVRGAATAACDAKMGYTICVRETVFARHGPGHGPGHGRGTGHVRAVARQPDSGGELEPTPANQPQKACQA